MRFHLEQVLLNNLKMFSGAVIPDILQTPMATFWEVAFNPYFSGDIETGQLKLEIKT